jgi:hypothetical protein
MEVHIMKKGKLKAVIGIVLVTSLTVSVFADSAIKLVLNGQELKSDVSPAVVSERVLVPIRVISEALGAKVTWDQATNSVIIDSKEMEAQKNQISLLENVLASKSQLAAVQSWAEGVKMRNGAWQYAIMSPELKKAQYDNFVESNWSTGVSSPWISEYKITEKFMIDKDTYRYEVLFTYTDSTKSIFKNREIITVKNIEGTWLLTSIEKIEATGAITTVTLGEDNKVKSVFIVDQAPTAGSYDQANVMIGIGTKIYKGYTNQELAASDLKVGTKIEVAFTDGPRLAIYPVSAVATTIRVIE